MKQIDEYFSVFNKNLDALPNSVDHKEMLDSDYKPQIGIARKSITPILRKVGLISASAIILLSVSLILFSLINAEEFEVFLVNIAEKLNIIDTRSGFDFMNITDINYVELSDDELAAIGIVKKGDTVSVITEQLATPELMTPSTSVDSTKLLDSLKKLPENQEPNTSVKVSIFTNQRMARKGYDTNNVQLIKSKYNISFYSFNSYTMHYQGWEHNKYSSFAPVSIQSFCKSKARHNSNYITSNYASPILNEYKSGIDTLFKYFIGVRSEIKISSMGALSRLIPVRIKLYNRSGYKPEKKKYTIVEAEIVLWYVPTEEFINALPERYASRLRNELDVIEKIEKGEIKKEEACKELIVSESILGLCPVYHENLEIKSIYPSPGREDTHLKFSNGIPQKLNILLYSLRGEELQKLAQNKHFEIGEHDIWIDLSKLERGIYLIVIIDGEGNAISSKLIKE